MRLVAAALTTLTITACSPNTVQEPAASVSVPSVAEAGAPSQTPQRATGDENTYLRTARESLTVHSPDLLLKTGYRVCDQVEKGWDYQFIHDDVDAALWPPDKPRPTSYLIPDFANYRDDELITLAMMHLCGMEPAEVGEYVQAHGGGE
ncbi:hypothetical protein [Mycolicibacterium nivoides]|uniref:hypothetical protein n=1 Tax=Mycolicibacterium nivoides TaxID=2487344 RepID=UPI000F5BA9B0|nr:hypothetical protein [Mycolicibacterium nivoides]